MYLISETVNPLFQCFFLFPVSTVPVVVVRAVAFSLNETVVNVDVVPAVVHIALAVPEFLDGAAVGGYPMLAFNGLIPPAVDTVSVVHFLFLYSSNVGGAMPSSRHFSLKISYCSSMGMC
jgi:hypothetical protein